MDAAAIVTRIRSAGYLPALIDDKVRLYRDAADLPAELHDAIATNRAAVVAYLSRPEQSIAHDLIANAAEAGWFPSINGSVLEWRRGDELTVNPMRSEALRSALEQQRDVVVTVLQQVSTGCSNRERCMRVGTCAKETDANGCTANMSESPAIPPSHAQAMTAEPPPEGPYHRIWSCASCHLPRSGDSRPCPACGHVKGYTALRPANRFTGLL